MDKKKNNKNKQEHYTQILLEDMNSKIDLMAEQHGSIVEKLDRVTATTERLVVDVDVLKSIARTHSESIKRVENKVDNLEVKVDKLEVKVDNLEVKVDNLGVKVDKIDQRVTILEIGLTRVENKLDVNIADHEKRICKLEETASIAN